MKQMVFCLAVMLLFTGASFGVNNLLTNGEFDLFDAGWGSMGEWGSPYFYQLDEVDDNGEFIVSLGGWGDGDSWSAASIWQETGETFRADTQYVLVVNWRDPESKIIDIQLSLQTVGEEWVDVSVDWYEPTNSPDWEDAMLVFDTADDPSVVGSVIGAGVRLSSTEGAWLHIDSVTLFTGQASDPDPENDLDPFDDIGEVGEVGDDGVDITLSWKTAVDLDDSPDFTTPDPDVTKHYLYVQENDPNMGGLTTPLAEIPAGSPVEAEAMYELTGPNFGSVYYWRIDESINGSTPTSADTLVGQVWAFETIQEAVVVNSQSQDTLVAEGESASFSLEVTSPSPPAFAWYLGDGPEADPLGDTLLGTTDVPEFTIESTPLSYAGKYVYAVITNLSPNATVSGLALLEVERLMGYWKMDGNLEDSSANTFAGAYSDPNTANDPPDEIYNSVDALDGESFVLENDELHVQVTGSENAFNNYHLGLTVSAWVKTTVPAWTGIVSKQYRVDPDPYLGWVFGTDWLGRPYLSIRGVDTTPGEVSSVSDGLWHLITGTYDGSVIRMYVDGELEGETAASELTAELNDQPVLIGAETVAGATAFAGLVDEVQIYNYAKNANSVLDIYNGIVEPDKILCIDPYAVGADISGPDGEPDCKVDMYDFAELAAGWLSCGLYPDCP